MTEEQLAFYREQFERVWPWLEKAIAHYGPTHEKHHVWEMIEREQVHLFVSDTGALITIIEEYPTGLKELRIWLGGGNLAGLLKLRPLVEAWKQYSGCHRMRIDGRVGWSRVFDVKRRAAIMIEE